MVSKHQILKRANEESALRLASFLPDPPAMTAPEPKDVSEFAESSINTVSTPKLDVFHSTYLSGELKVIVWDIFEDNMKNLYIDSTFSWDPPTKKEELFSPLSRFLVISSALLSSDTKFPNVLGYVMFRFEEEYSDNVLYCYELQVAKSAQRKGLGKFLMLALENIAKELHMDRIMLTVFKKNIIAVKFYQSIGFIPDETSPDEEDDMDYFILTKSIQIEKPQS